MVKNDNVLDLIPDNSLSELTTEELLTISGGKVPISTHLLRAASGSFFGICYWIGYGAEKLLEN